MTDKHTPPEGNGASRGGGARLWAVMLIAGVLIVSVSAYFRLQKRSTEPAAEDAPAKPDPTAKQADAEDEWARLDSTKEYAPAAAGPPVKQEVARNLMGTRFEITMYAPSGAYNATRLTEIGQAALDRVAELERRISTWRIDSFTSKLNREAAEGPVKVHPDLMRLLKVSRQAYDDTDGVFDVTVGPLLDLWGVYKKKGSLPSQDAIRETLQRVGLDNVQLDFDNRTVRYARPGLRLDFGGIGKGYALDVAAQVLKGHGIECALLSGGESTFVALGAPPETPGWNVIVDKVYRETGVDDYVDRFVIKDEAFSTSSGEGLSFEDDGQRYSHIYDPRTGQAVDETLGAMAITTTGAMADALSTAFLVMSEPEVREFCGEHPDVKAIKVGLVDGKPQPVRINYPAS